MRAAFATAWVARGYGMTDLAPMATSSMPTDSARSAGRATPHTLVEIVDPCGIELPAAPSAAPT
jgi:long-subunit acyl-CoA synthetase (AMP-forming)